MRIPENINLNRQSIRTIERNSIEYECTALKLLILMDKMTTVASTKQVIFSFDDTKKSTSSRYLLYASLARKTADLSFHSTENVRLLTQFEKRLPVDQK